MPRDVRELPEWIDKHPWLACAFFIGAALLIAEVAFLLSQLTAGLQ